jgi:hypothetical protein
MITKLNASILEHRSAILSSARKNCQKHLNIPKLLGNMFVTKRAEAPFLQVTADFNVILPFARLSFQ